MYNVADPVFIKQVQNAWISTDGARPVARDKVPDDVEDTVILSPREDRVLFDLASDT